MGNCCCNKTEHYVVKPNTPVYDWPYEYSSSSNSNQKGCCCNSEALMVTIGTLQSTLASLQNAITEASTGNIDPQQIESAVARYLSAADNAEALKQLVDNEIRDKFGMTSTNDIINLKQQVSSILTEIGKLQPVVNNITKLTELTDLDVEELAQYRDEITNINADLSSLESRIQTLEGKVDNITDNLVDTVNSAVETKLQDSNTLNSKIQEAINNNSTISQIQQNLTNHINDNSKHFKSGDIHITQEMVNRWNNNTGGGSSVSFEYDAQNKALQITA